jgi:hypothetical protein
LHRLSLFDPFGPWSLTTRAVAGIDSSVKVNRALWMLAEEMRRLKA